MLAHNSSKKLPSNISLNTCRFDRTVAILLATRNGGHYLAEQLASYADQTHTKWSLFVSDDRSFDDTLRIVDGFSKSIANSVTVKTGPECGFAQNFASLARDPNIAADFYAFSDQDDVWYHDKLERALSWLSGFSDDTPTLYFSRTELVNEKGNHLGYSPLFSRLPSFHNALVQNIGGGNTMVFNIATKRLCEATPMLGLISHDWALYQLVTAVGGIARYDPEPTLKYRQHASNLLGSNRGPSAGLKRIQMLFKGRFAGWMSKNIDNLRSIEAAIPASNLETIELLARARSSPVMLLRVWYLARSRVYRQTALGNLGLILAAMFRKL